MADSPAAGDKPFCGLRPVLPGRLSKESQRGCSEDR